MTELTQSDEIDQIMKDITTEADARACLKMALWANAYNELLLDGAQSILADFMQLDDAPEDLAAMAGSLILRIPR